MRESDRFFGCSTNATISCSAATSNNSRNRNFVHWKDHGRIEAGIPSSPRPDRRRRPYLGLWWSSRRVATAAEDRLSFRRKSAHVICGGQRLPNSRDL